MPQETQQKTFKFVKSSEGKINFRATEKKPTPSEFRPLRPLRTH